MNANIQPGALVRADAEKYVGGKTVFLALQQRFPELLRPFYRTSKRTVFTIETLDAAMKAALLESEPLTTIDNKHQPINTPYYMNGEANDREQLD
jgi:hypothetical protein